MCHNTTVKWDSAKSMPNHQGEFTLLKKKNPLGWILLWWIWCQWVPKSEADTSLLRSPHKPAELYLSGPFRGGVYKTLVLNHPLEWHHQLYLDGCQEEIPCDHQYRIHCTVVAEVVLSRCLLSEDPSTLLCLVLVTEAVMLLPRLIMGLTDLLARSWNSPGRGNSISVLSPGATFCWCGWPLSPGARLRTLNSLHPRQ